MKPGPLLVAAGLVLVLAGLLVIAAQRFPVLSWVGRLPGDIRIERPNFRFYFPLATCVVFSLVLTAIASLVRFFSRH